MNKKRRSRKLPIILEREEVKKLLALGSTRYLTSLRDKAIISLMTNCGLRVSEVVNLKPGDLNITKGKLWIVAGKGGVDRDIPFIPDNTVALLKKWKKRKPQSDYFFSNVKNSNKGKFASLQGNKLAVRTVQAMVKNYTKRAGIDKTVSPHTLRHTFATNFYRDTKDLEALRVILGHASISTTQIYVTLSNLDTENGMREFKEFI